LRGAARRTVRLLLGTSFLALVGTACQTAPPPEPGSTQGTAPDLRGRTVMVLPFQQVRGFRGTPDAELLFHLQERAGEVGWVAPDEVDEALSRAPAMDADARGLPVGAFLAGEVRRVGDPLYGQLRRLGALVDAEVVLLPVRATSRPDTTGAAVIRVEAALLALRTGRVLWYGVEEGLPGDPSDPSILASSVEALARSLLWYASP